MIAPDANSRWVRIGSADEFAEDEPIRRSLGGFDIAVFRVDGELYALDDHCSHGNASLSEGWVEGNCVECPLHQARFNLRTGEPETGPALEPVRSFKLRTEGTDVFVEL
ncbi:nitrite reductase/ring-hydroxylating ferredoxin subunit [Sphingopyxis panaciterrae]|uniref:non-heme iron oxygenase ferredoxin subunit n=1 Tax=Sphingopyxis panaciterrae TaxID=363841 RepID=UPI00141E5736|nr:non-heme iron oxygenase ferredoxin subunit [Sphingopyxis panaciterrae]NIJ37451.1 nitrite reductase/ring-hydroxylating ferredoxin subunit [Sphingopyxis panaciterrae]